MNKRPVILDLGPHHHAALALMWVLSSEQLELKGITCIADHPEALERSVMNALSLISQAGATEIPVARGANAPIVSHDQQRLVQQYAEARMAQLPNPSEKLASSPLSAVELMIQMLEEAETPITICATGPLTNIAQLLLTRPDLKAKIEQIAIAAGGAGKGDITPVAEFNIFADPEAANVVFHAGLPVLMAGLDVAHRAYITPEEAQSIRSKGTASAVLAADLLDQLASFTSQDEDFSGSIVLGPCMIAALLEPELFKSIYTHVDIEIAGALTRGMTVVNQIAFLEMPENANVVLHVDRDKFVDSFMKALDH